MRDGFEPRAHAAVLSEITIKDARERLFRCFDDLKLSAPVVPYPAHKTVEEGKLLRGAMAGTFTKNLLLRDKKERLFLFATHADRASI